MKVTDKGYINFRNFQTYYEVYGKRKGSRRPLLVVHGGPGSTHNYLLGLAELHDRQVIFYDQLGSGLSDRPDDESLWTIETFVDELKTVREQLNLNDIHMLGHSWGGMLAIEYMLTQPQGIASVTLASSMISMPLYNAEVEKLKQALGPQVYKVMINNEQAGTTDSPEYKKAYAVYSKAHLFNGEMFPPELEAPKGTNGNAAYVKMWGVSEAYAHGTMSAWDMVDRLHEITVPTLITSGQNDELTPYQAEITHAKIKGSELAIFMGGTHLVHIEQAANYRKRLEQFLASTDIS